ncbi:Crp/Fnr family transcriptional regulator [Maribacter sp. 2210JD10-5]|uniref:Crp/Fnr family transcriptional regulator n=1 Tax=Maribacter sp. 2210JD10-5 TaxID=3386272 RepID=UPI0039BD73A3
MKEHLRASLRDINPDFSQNDIETGLQCFDFKKYKAKDLITKEGSLADYLFFANSSITRCYYLDEKGEEITLWMKPEKTFIAEYKSFTSQLKSQFNLQFYEDTEVLMINRVNLLQLFKNNNNWAMFGILLTEQLHVTLIDVFVNLLANDATRNYQYIQSAFPRFLQVAPLKDIASMLQVSQVTLSRIRSGTQLKG